MTREGCLQQDAAFGEPDWALIELMFFAYRNFVADADRILAVDGFGRAHHRVLYFVSRRPGRTVAELLEILAITKQSLNRVLKDLLDRGFVASRLGTEDRRQRLLHATPRGDALILEVARAQSARLSRALADGSRSEAVEFLSGVAGNPSPAPLGPEPGSDPHRDGG